MYTKFLNIKCFCFESLQNMKYYIYEFKAWLQYQPICKNLFDIYDYLKGRFWKKHTIIHPRHLHYTWCDKTELIPHLVFESLCQFVENEKPFENVCWDHYNDYKKVKKIIKDNYRWWNEVYIPWFWKGKVYNQIWKIMPERISTFQKDSSGKYFRYSPKYHSKEDKQFERILFKVLTESDERVSEELTQRCQDIISIRTYLWT